MALAVVDCDDGEWATKRREQRRIHCRCPQRDSNEWDEHNWKEVIEVEARATCWEFPMTAQSTPGHTGQVVKKKKKRDKQALGLSRVTVVDEKRAGERGDGWHGWARPAGLGWAGCYGVVSSLSLRSMGTSISVCVHVHCSTRNHTHTRTHTHTHTHMQSAQ